MSKRYGWIFPGQGAQYPGMGKDFYDEFVEVKEVFEWADEILKRPFSKLIFDGPSKELTETKNSQLAIFITSIAILRAFEKTSLQISPLVCGGLSLGEYTALVASKKLTFDQTLKLVAARSGFMQEACEENPGVMHVVLGLTKEQVVDALEGTEGVWIANLNCPGQVVISGTKQEIEKVQEPLKDKGARCIMPLEVSGPFHSGLMLSAKEKLRPFIEKAEITPSKTQLVMNVSGGLVEEASEIKQQMIEQVTAPVLWHDCVDAMCDLGVDLFLEIGPGKTLAGMNKRIGVKVPTISIESLSNLEKVVQDGTYV